MVVSSLQLVDPFNVYTYITITNEIIKLIHLAKLLLLPKHEWKKLYSSRRREKISGASESCHSSFCSASYISSLRVFHRITRADVEISIHEPPPSKLKITSASDQTQRRPRRISAAPRLNAATTVELSTLVRRMAN